MLDLAENGGVKPRMISDICKAQGFSRKYVGRLILKLKKADMIYSIRGTKGGYKIKKMPKYISLLEIVETMEGSISLVDCVLCPKKCKRSTNCEARKIWDELNEKIKDNFAQISLQDIIDRHKGSKDYCI